MSMISAQCDKLRELATRYDELQAGTVRAVRVPLNMGSVLREAADTIWELRCRLVDAEDRVRKREAEATELGRGGCHDYGNSQIFVCSECECRLALRDEDFEPTMWVNYEASVPHFCPNCGARIEVDE